MKLILDMDCTLYPFGIIQALETLYPERPKSTYEDMKKWTWYRPTYTKKEFYQAVDLAHSLQGTIPPYPDAAYWVRRMAKRVPVVVASHRNNRHLANMESWLNAYKIPHDGVYCSFNHKKSLFVPGDLVIDDCVNTIRIALDEGCHVGTLIHPWNTNMGELDINPLLVYGFTWKELGQKVYDIVKGEHR